MSQENVEIVRRAYEEFKATRRAARQLMTPDYVWDASTLRGWPDEPQYAGAEGLEEFMSKWLEPYEEWDLEMQEIRAVDDGRVLVLGKQRGRLPGSDSWVELSFGQIVTISGGLMSRSQIYGNQPEALEAVGLSE